MMKFFEIFVQLILSPRPEIIAFWDIYKKQRINNTNEKRTLNI